MSGIQGWTDLPDVLLHSIVPLLESFLDLLAFHATCRSWHAAFSSYPSKSTLLTLLPPLLLEPDIPLSSPHPRPFRDILVHERPCHVTDLANQNNKRCCQIPLFALLFHKNPPPSPLTSFCFTGASFGHLILSNKQSCLVVDVFTGVSVSPPQLPVDEDTQLYFATLTAPLASPNSHLMVTTGSHNFFWRVGTDYWLRRTRRKSTIKRVVVFKGQVFCMDNDDMLFIVHFVPQIRIQKIAVDWEESSVSRVSQMWLVACGDKLLMVGCWQSAVDTFEAFSLDLSSEPAKWVKVERLENWAIFISVDERSQALCCMNPERWGGRSNLIYCYDSKNWIAFELGEPLQGDDSNPSVFIFIYSGSMMQPMWVVPSMFS
ncbi:unnamed protein product [Alopecurus aequalis]